MIHIRTEAAKRGITRLCHFTQSRNLAHIFGDNNGILSSHRLASLDLPYNPTDIDRFDKCDHLVCCSLEYPNTYYFSTARSHDPLFKDWVVLLLKPDYLWTTGTKFCPCNAAKNCGAYIKDGFDSFMSLFDITTPGNFNRSASHLYCAPTNIQAEVLIPDPIPLDAITAIAVESEEQAKRELCRASLQGISIDKPILIVPDFYQRATISQLIRQGIRLQEIPYVPGGHHGK